MIQCDVCRVTSDVPDPLSWRGMMANEVTTLRHEISKNVRRELETWGSI